MKRTACVLAVIFQLVTAATAAAIAVDVSVSGPGSESNQGSGTATANPSDGMHSTTLTFLGQTRASGMIAVDLVLADALLCWNPEPLDPSTGLASASGGHYSGSIAMDFGVDGTATATVDMTGAQLTVGVDLSGYTGTEVPPAEYTLNDARVFSSGGPGQALGSGTFVAAGGISGTVTSNYTLHGNPGGTIEWIHVQGGTQVQLTGNQMSATGTSTVRGARATPAASILSAILVAAVMMLAGVLTFVHRTRGKSHRRGA